MTKTESKFYEIRVSQGRAKVYLTTRWYPPGGWSKRAIDRELAKQAAEFEGQAQATCVKVYTILQGIFKMAYLADLIDRNPMDKVERPKPRKDEMKKPAEAESYTAGELKHILADKGRLPGHAQERQDLPSNALGTFFGVRWRRRKMENRPIGIVIAYGFLYGFFALSTRGNRDNQNRKIPRNHLIPRDLTGAAKQI